MTAPELDEDLLAEIAHRLDLREPNANAVRTVAARTADHYQVQSKGSPFECIVDSATGVGKTYVMAGLIEYFAGLDTPARNFLLLAPGRTIRDKSIKNFTPGARKSLTKAMRSAPLLVTADNFKSPATMTAMRDSSITKLYVFTVQKLTSKTGDGKEVHEYREELGGSFYEFLSGIGDLVVLADEHHCYRSSAYSRTISELNPQLVVGLTATPAKADESMVVYRYPLAAAISDKLVKTPIVVGRRDDRNDDQTKLLDGVTLLRCKEQALVAFCANNDLTPVNPVMMVIARDIAEAEEFTARLDSLEFDGGAWAGRTLLVHSGMTGDTKEDVLAALEAVEDPDSAVRIIVNVGMLKEGWDVKNVYVIASMRASVSDVLTEQTLGRGMRLPFGRYTGVELLDSVEVLAHEKYSELLARRKSLTEAFVDFETYTEATRKPDGALVITETEIPIEVAVITTATQHGLADDPLPGRPDEGAVAEEGDTGAGVAVVITDIDTRTQQAQQAADEAAVPQLNCDPLPDREAVVIPKLISRATPARVSLNDIDEERFGAFEQLGRALAADLTDELRRTKIVGKIKGRVATTETEVAQDLIHGSRGLDLALADAKLLLVSAVLAVEGVEKRPSEVGAAERIVDAVVDAMGADVQNTLSAYIERCARRLAEQVRNVLRQTSKAQVNFDDDIELVPLTKTRGAMKRTVDKHPDDGFDKALAFGGWKRNLYEYAWFDTRPEYAAAVAIDQGPHVLVWARLHINDVSIAWSGTGGRYNPDLVVIEERDGKRSGWLVETKMNKGMDTDEVQGKRAAAKKWVNVANSTLKSPRWQYLLLSEDHVQAAKGSWEQMKALGFR